MILAPRFGAFFLEALLQLLRRIDTQLSPSTLARLSDLRGSWLAWVVVSSIVVIAVGWMTFIDERPFWIVTTDPEHDYYFNSLTVLETGFPESVRHPGTVIYYFGAALLAIAGTDFSEAQQFFNFTYIAAAILFIFALAVFTRVALSGVPFAPSFLILSSLLIWPSFATYSNYFSVESFILTVGLVLSAYTYVTMSGSRSINRYSLLVFGGLIGLGVALKFSFAPVGIAIGLMLASGALWSRSGSTLGVRALDGTGRVAMLVSISLISFLVFVFPVARYLYAFIGRLRIEITKPSESESIVEAVSRFLRLAPEYGILLILAVIGLGVLIFVQARRGTVESSDGTGGGSKSQSVTLFLVLLGFGLVLSRSIFDPDGAAFVDPGHFLRHMTPVAGFLPIGLLVVWKTHIRTFPDISKVTLHRRVQNVAVVALGVGLVVSSLGGYMYWRADNFADIADSVGVNTRQLEEINTAGARVAIWDYGHSFGEPMFFYWGNYRYSIDRFDEKLMAAFPEYSIIHLREVAGLASAIRAGDSTVGGSDNGETASGSGLLRGPAQEIYDSVVGTWSERFPRRMRNGELLTGENSSDDWVVLYRPQAVAFLSEGSDNSEGQLHQVFTSKFESVEYSQIGISGETWIVAHLGSR